MREKGEGRNRELWFSICSKHRNYDPTCNLCNAGHWVKAWKHELSSCFYEISPSLWRLWVNKLYIPHIWAKIKYRKR